MKQILVCGSSGFLGHHLARRLKNEGHRIVGVDIREPEFPIDLDEFFHLDLSDRMQCVRVFEWPYDEVYQVAAMNGGAELIYGGKNDSAIIMNNVAINANVINCSIGSKVFFSSSSCLYSQHVPGGELITKESCVYPADCDSDYGWEKLFSERMYQAARRERDLNIRIARFFNLYGPECWLSSPREHAEAALARKVIQAPDGGEIEIWGSGKQRRSYLYIEDTLDAIQALMEAPIPAALNIGPDTDASIDEVALELIAISGKRLTLKHQENIKLGADSRKCDSMLSEQLLPWRPKWSLKDGLRETYDWIATQIKTAAAVIA